MVLLVTIDKFDPNLVLVNINKLKPYRFINDSTLQLVLVNPNDLAIKKPIENEVFELVPIEPITNHQNDTLVVMNVGVCLVEVYNLKGHVYSQLPHL
jgi:hypothetical protein